MKKLVLLLLVILSAFSFGANFKPYLKANTSNPDAKKDSFFCTNGKYKKSCYSI